METPKEENLRKMSYTELRKKARESGITKKLKADELISLLLGKAKDAEDSFVTLENEIINSCRKNKSAKFDEDKLVESDTPRRETYTLDRPTGSVTTVNAVDSDLIVSSASPVLRKTPAATNDISLNVTMSRGSERKMKKRKVSFVTPLRKSARISSMTPRFASVKDRPKTPIPTRFSSGKKSSPSVKAKISFTESPSQMKVENSGSKKSGRKGKRVSTPMPSSKCKRMNLSSSGLNAPIATPEVSFTEPSKEIIVEENTNMDVKEVGTPTPLNVSKLHLLTPKSDVKKTPVPVFQFSATPDKKTATPKSDVKKTPVPVFKFSATPDKKTATPKVNVKEVVTASALKIAKAGGITPKSNVKRTTPRAVNLKNIRTITPRSNIKKAATPFSTNPKSIRIVTPRSQAKRIATPLSVTAKDKRTPRSCVKTSTPGVLSASKVKIPNFKDLHQKEFNKMESIDEYQQRKAVNSAKKLKEQAHCQNLAKSSASKRVVHKNKKVKEFGGIPFVPSITSTKDMKLSASIFKSQIVANKKYASSFCKGIIASVKKADTPVAKKPVQKNLKPVSRENTPLKKRFRFDLQASLTKKLPYKPHKGPLKPLAEKNSNNTSILNSAPTKPATENKMIAAKRVESRSVLRGVRMNRRFELQMQKRNLSTC